MRRTVLSLWSATGVAVLAGCVYYNAMWSAERFAKDARRLESRGREAEARSQWARAAAKAESVAVRHPRSRWADDALALQVEGLARSGSCETAARPIEKARTSVHEPGLRERIGLAAALCALAAGRPGQADIALTEVLASPNGARRSQAEYLAGQAAMLRLDYASALEHFRRSRESNAALARAHALIAAGHATEANALLDTLVTARLSESERADLLAKLAPVSGAEAASRALDAQLLRARLPFAQQARLLIADGDRRLAAGDYDAAVAQYRRAAAVAPATNEAGTASVREQRVSIARATHRDDLEAVTAELTRLARSDASAAASAQSLLELVLLATATAETPGARFRAAEVARDSLGAAALAGQLFLDAAAADSASLYAPKALVAALPLLPARRDSIVAVLETRYAASPYTRVYHGEPSVAYAAAEDSLARELGVQVAQSTPPAGTRVDAPRPGPRGPLLDEPAPSVRQPPARAPRATERAPARP
jgi:hypothetical protein